MAILPEQRLGIALKVADGATRASECAIVIPEAQVLETVHILQKISKQERCQRRKRCYEIYTKYMANAEATLAGVLESATLAIQSLSANGQSMGG